MSSVLSFFKNLLALAKTSFKFRPSSPDQVKTSRIKTAFASVGRNVFSAKTRSHGGVPSVERAGDERPIAGVSVTEDASQGPRINDPGSIDGANPPSFGHLPASRSTVVEMESENVKSSGSSSLNRVATGLCHLLKQFEQTTSNKDDGGKLTSRIQGLIESLSYDHNCDEAENQGRKSLKSKLDKALQKLDSLAQQGSISAFFNNADQDGALLEFTKEIRDAITDYQTALQAAIFKRVVESADMEWLNLLSHTYDASHLAGKRGRCLPGTRTELLQKIKEWINNPEAPRVCWLNGVAGTGKSTIAQSIAEWIYELEIWLLGASFFCSRDFVGTRELRHIFPTLAFQLACRYPDFRPLLIDAIRKNPDIAHHSLSDQFQQLLFRPLTDSGLKTVIIIDALDECIDDEPASAMLSVLSQYIDQLPSVKFFITGRPEPQIGSGFHIPSLQHHTQTMILHDIKSTLVDRDIEIYFKTRFSELGIRMGSVDGWPGENDIATLVCKSRGLFIYAETTFRFISSKHENPRKMLQLIVNVPDTGVNEALLSVDDLYTHILRLGFVDVDARRATVIYEKFRTIVGSIVLLFYPLSIDDIALLLDLDPLDISASLLSLHSLLHIPDKSSDPVRIIHKSFPDYILDPKRCTDVNLCIDPATNHATMTLGCLDLMKKRLKQNICHFPPYAMNDEVEDLEVRKDQFIGSALEYACQFWTRHLQKATGRDTEHIKNIVVALTQFFKHNSLPWLEVLSIIGKLPLAIHALHIIRRWLSALEYDTQEVSDMAEDCSRFALHFFDGIQQSSQHIYRSGLPLCPTSSLIRTLYQQDPASEVKIMRGIEHEWDSCMRTIPVRKPVSAVAISQREDMIGVGDESGRCHIFEAVSGSVKTVWETSDLVISVAFSADGSLFTSGDEGGNVTVWDVQSGIRKVLFQGGAENPVMSIAFSPRGTLLVSGTKDRKVRIWDVTSKEPLKRTLEGHTDLVRSVCWSNDGSKILSGSDDELMKVWDSSTGHGLHTIQVEKNIVCVAWSPDGSKLGLSTGWRIIIYHARTYEQLGSFIVEGHCFSLDFCPKEDHLVYSSGSLVLVRNLNLDVDVSRFVGHTHEVHSVAFSSGGTTIVSGAVDGMVKIWRFRSGEKGFDHEQETPHTVSFSPNGLLMATATKNEPEVKLWDAMTCSHIYSLYLDLEQAERWPTLAFSPDSSLLACGFIWTKSMRIWDMNTRAVISDLRDAQLNGFCFSRDGERIAMYSDRTIQLWDVREGNLTAELTWTKKIDHHSEIAFFEDGSGIQIAQSNPIILDIVTSSHQSDDDDDCEEDSAEETSSRSLEFVISSKNKPPLFLKHRDHASYKVADKMDWVLDTKNRSVCSIPPDQRPDDESHSWDAHGAKIAWCGDKGLVFLDFAHISTDTDGDIDNTDSLYALVQ